VPGIKKAFEPLHSLQQGYVYARSQLGMKVSSCLPSLQLWNQPDPVPTSPNSLQFCLSRSVQPRASLETTALVEWQTFLRFGDLMIHFGHGTAIDGPDHAVSDDLDSFRLPASPVTSFHFIVPDSRPAPELARVLRDPGRLGIFHRRRGFCRRSSADFDALPR